MLAIISPAKTLDFETPPLTDTFSTPDFLDQSKKLISGLRRLSEAQLGALMSISPNLAEQNARRYREWKTPFSLDNAKQALMAFKGEVYTGFNLEEWDEDDFSQAQGHLRILSGLYGLLRPLDLIQAYRLEMGTKFEGKHGKNLYKFWGSAITEALNKAIAASGGDVLVNLASNEYFQAVDQQLLEARVVTPVFKDLKNGSYKFLSFYGKKARGAMSDFIILNRVADPEGLKKFKGMGYRFNKKLSDGDTWTFTRDTPAAAA